MKEGFVALALCLRTFLGSGLTPELSRTDLRPRRWHSLRRHAEAAKRSRLERIVRCQVWGAWGVTPSRRVQHLGQQRRLRRSDKSADFAWEGLAERQAIQIGRASCRERRKNAVVVVTVQ